MILATNNSVENIFLSSSNSNNYNKLLDKKINIILSPEYYWVRYFDIPVKTEKEAIKFLPSLFEDFIPDISNLTFHVIKNDKNYICFAYDNKMILEELKRVNINTNLIKGVYFAQNEMKEFKSFMISDKNYYYTDDKILIALPNSINNLYENIETKINSINLSSNKLKIKFYKTFVKNKYLNYTFAFVIVLLFINTTKIFILNSEIKKANEQIEKVKKISTLPSSKIQTKSILKKYDLEVSLELKKRDAIEYLLSNPYFKFSKIEYSNKSFNVTFTSTDKRTALDYISKKYKIINSKNSNFNFDVSFEI